MIVTRILAPTSKLATLRQLQETPAIHTYFHAPPYSLGTFLSAVIAR